MPARTAGSGEGPRLAQEQAAAITSRERNPVFMARWSAPFSLVPGGRARDRRRSGVASRRRLRRALAGHRGSAWLRWRLRYGGEQRDFTVYGELSTEGRIGRLGRRCRLRCSCAAGGRQPPTGGCVEGCAGHIGAITLVSGVIRRRAFRGLSGGSREVRS